MPVTFYPHNHTYLNEQGQKYISVTTLIKKYTPPFDEDYWSSYKALKDVLEQAEVWDVYKSRAGGWEQVLDYCRKLKNFPYRDAVIQRKKYYISHWKQKGEEAREKGSAFHAAAEAALLGKTFITESKREALVVPGGDLIETQDFKSDALYPELLIYNHRFRLAGQADWVLKEGDTVHIKDYKTSREIVQSAFRNETMLYPLGHIPNANYHTYSLQLSIYAWMLENKGFKVGRLEIEHVIDEQERKLYPVKYLKDEVITLLKHYEKERKKENRNLKKSAERPAGGTVVSSKY
jgi:hypothetical protein